MAVALNTAQSDSVPIRALRNKTKQVISDLLNTEKVILSESGHQRDWRGLAILAGLPNTKIYAIASNADPTARVLEIWYDEKKNEATIQLLHNFLEEIDRFDVIDDTAALIEEDVKNFKETVNNNHCDNSYAFRENYDAYVLYAEDDIAIATDLMEKLERHYDLKLCTKDRDLNGSVPFEYREIINLIAECCNRLILICTPAFFQSKAIEFYYSFAQAMSIEQNERKIIPCIFKPCELPIQLMFYTSLKHGSVFFWDKLRDCIRTPVKKTKNVTRSISMQPNMKQPLQSAAAAVTECAASAPKERKARVTFGSLQDLNKTKETEVQESAAARDQLQPTISQNPSSVSLNEMAEHPMHKKSKNPKISRLLSISKKILPAKNKEPKAKSPDSFGDKEKKHFWSKPKSKVAVAS